VDDALLVRGVKRLRDLTCDRQRLANRHGSLSDAIGKRYTLDQLQGERLYPIRFFEPVDPAMFG